MRFVLSRALLASALAIVGLFAAAILVPSDASASVSIAMGYDALVKDADNVVLVTPGDQSSVWEDGRIYTYTKVKVDQPVAGDLPAGGEGFVRTMGGVVGQIGQMVDGEPVFTSGQQSMLFLRKLKVSSTFEVSGRAQGQFPVVVNEVTKLKTLSRSSNAGMLLPPKALPAATATATPASGVSTQSVKDTPQLVARLRLASEVIHGRAIGDAANEISASWKKVHVPVVNDAAK